MLVINIDKIMHQLNYGQSICVKILIGLIKPFKMILLEEIMTYQDICVMQDLLNWLIQESNEPGTTIDGNYLFSIIKKSGNSPSPFLVAMNQLFSRVIFINDCICILTGSPR